MKECSKSIQRRLHTPAFASRYFVGSGVDIGGKPDPLSLYRHLFCRMESCQTWDIDDGDAQHMDGVADSSYDFVHSSHCLEHMQDPFEALANWIRILKPGGHAIIIVPDEDMYEQRIWPSRFNKDHKWSFTVNKTSSWSPKSVNVLDLIQSVAVQTQLVSLLVLRDTYRQINAVFDQTLTPVGECGVEFVLLKNMEETKLIEPDREITIHFNQYADDYAALKLGNKDWEPFKNEKPLEKKLP